MNEVRVTIYTFQKMLTTIDLRSFKLLASECLISKLFSLQENPPSSLRMHKMSSHTIRALEGQEAAKGRLGDGQ